jgi:pyruvate/2-oxoglutarate dehydrogenase complex dihydrolipoamide dehydrogenase (E3) component
MTSSYDVIVIGSGAGGGTSLIVWRPLASGSSRSSAVTG